MRKIIFEESSNGITIDRIIRSYNYNMPTKHFHDEYELYYLLEGERYYFIEQQSFYIKKGTVVLVNKGQIHKTSFVNTTYHDRILIELKEEPFATFFNSIGELNIDELFTKHSGIFKLDEKGQRYVEILLNGIATEIHNKLIGYQTSVMTKLASLFIFLLRNQNDVSSESNTTKITTSKHKKVDEVASYIVNNYTNGISLDAIAKHFFVSKCYLSRIFKEVTGFTINEYINIHRIQKAQELIVNSDSNITEISKLVGFENISYFEKVFKKYTETSPLKYRKQNKQIVPPVRMKKAE
jgi:YesN/AraC family two-component response regulator